MALVSPAVQQLNWDVVTMLPWIVRRSFTPVFGRSETANNLKENDVYDMLLSDPSLAARAPEVFVRCGREDAYRLAQVTAFFGKFLDAVGVKNDIVLEPGGHDWAYWKRSLPYPSLVAFDAPWSDAPNG